MHVAYAKVNDTKVSLLYLLSGNSTDVRHLGRVRIHQARETKDPVNGSSSSHN